MKALEIGSFEAKNRLSELISMAEKGQKIFITRRGRRVALLIGARESKEMSGGRLLASIRAFRESARPGSESLKDLIEEGRH